MRSWHPQLQEVLAVGKILTTQPTGAPIHKKARVHIKPYKMSIAGAHPRKIVRPLTDQRRGSLPKWIIRVTGSGRADHARVRSASHEIDLIRQLKFGRLAQEENIAVDPGDRIGP